MVREKTEAINNRVQDLIERGFLYPNGEFKSFVEFKRNPPFDRVSLINFVGKKGGNKGSSISVDCLIAESMIEILGSRQNYVLWVRKSANYIKEKTLENRLNGTTGLSRLVQREAISVIKAHAEKSGVRVEKNSL